MQDPNADTEWNDALRKFNIIPPKKKEVEFTEDDVIKLVENTVLEKTENGNKPLDEMSLEELDDVEDEEDERAIQAYRMKRILEIKAEALKSRYGEVGEITAKDYVQEVNNAGKDIWVVLHLYQQGVPLCALVNNYLVSLARKFPQTKFLKSVSTLCIEKYPDKNLPTIFVYFEGNMKKQYVGSYQFGGMKLTVEGLEWMLAEAGAVKTDLRGPPQGKTIRDVMLTSLGATSQDADVDENDW